MKEHALPVAQKDTNEKIVKVNTIQRKLELTRTAENNGEIWNCKEHQSKRSTIKTENPGNSLFLKEK